MITSFVMDCHRNNGIDLSPAHIPWTELKGSKWNGRKKGLGNAGARRNMWELQMRSERESCDKNLTFFPFPRVRYFLGMQQSYLRRPLISPEQNLRLTKLQLAKWKQHDKNSALGLMSHLTSAQRNKLYNKAAYELGQRSLPKSQQTMKQIDSIFFDNYFTTSKPHPVSLQLSFIISN